ncbi:hypothetical protein J699_01380 [Acinetobacter sp. 1000160]|nr:hypothetical protein J522_1023 [Acinetobacter baumannii 146457]EYT21279.1 hypothetical protein J699_01380 [Acinetobacter sp. 1000160]
MSQICSNKQSWIRVSAQFPIAGNERKWRHLWNKMAFFCC